MVGQALSKKNFGTIICQTSRILIHSAQTNTAPFKTVLQCFLMQNPPFLRFLIPINFFLLLFSCLFPDSRTLLLVFLLSAAFSCLFFIQYSFPDISSLRRFFPVCFLFQYSSPDNFSFHRFFLPAAYPVISSFPHPPPSYLTYSKNLCI